MLSSSLSFVFGVDVIEYPATSYSVKRLIRIG